MHPGDCRDETVPEAEGPDRLQWAAVQMGLCAWDAWASARRGEAGDAARPRLDLAAGDAGKLAGRERDVREQDASCLQAHRVVLSVRRGAAAELCTQDAARSAERSCGAQAAVADLRLRAVQPDAAEPALPEAQKRQRPKVMQELRVQLSKPRVAPRDAEAEVWQQVGPAQKPKPRAFPPARIQLEAALPAQVSMKRLAVAQQQAERALRPEVQQQRA